MLSYLLNVEWHFNWNYDMFTIAKMLPCEYILNSVANWIFLASDEFYLHCSEKGNEGDRNYCEAFCNIKR